MLRVAAATSVPHLRNVAPTSYRLIACPGIAIVYACSANSPAFVGNVATKLPEYRRLNPEYRQFLSVPNSRLRPFGALPE
jgi:hypothetical protein